VEDSEPTRIVELPVEWIKDDTRSFGTTRASTIRPYTPPSAALEIFKKEFDGAVAEGSSAFSYPPCTRKSSGHRSRIAQLAGAARAHQADGRRLVRHPRGGRPLPDARVTSASAVLPSLRRGNLTHLPAVAASTVHIPDPCVATFVFNRPKALRVMGHEIGDCHFAAGDEGHIAGEETDSHQEADHHFE
jgi:hypothetical protein